MSTRTIGMSDQLYNYLLSVSVPPDPLWERLRDEATSSVGFNMQISPEQGQFMSVLVQMLGVNKALEIGTFTGFSALCVARAMPDHGQLIACDVSEQWTSIAKRYWAQAGLEHKIDLRLGSALETLDELIDQGAGASFDFAFIDADKENYGEYYERCLTLLRQRGLILIDNVLWGGRTADASNNEETTVAIRELTKKMQADDRIDFSLIPVGDGLSLAVKR